MTAWVGTALHSKVVVVLVRCSMPDQIRPCSLTLKAVQNLLNLPKKKVKTDTLHFKVWALSFLKKINKPIQYILFSK